MKKQNHKLRSVILLALLAILCICGVELAACRHFAPEFYDRLTAPVRQGAQAAAHLVSDTASALYEGACAALDGAAEQASLFWADLTAPKEEELPAPDTLDNQQISEPVLTDHKPVEEPLLTELRTEDGRDILTGGMVNVVYFNQGDEVWRDQPYGSDDIGTYGCGPTAMAMAVASLTDEETDPAAMAQWAVEQGYWARRSGSYHSIVEGIAADYGLTVESLTQRTPDELTDALLSGKLLVALMGPGHFTEKGHFILLRGVAPNGGILVADPNSVDRSLTLWDPQLLLDELSSSTNSGAPLWALSTDES